MSGGPLSQVLEEVWSKFDYGAALADLNPRVTERRIYVRCPRCNQPSGWILPGQTVIRCNHANKCGVSTSILGHLIGLAEVPTGEDFKRAVREACRLTHVPYPDSKEDQQRAEQYQKRTSALETLWQVAHGAFADLDPLSDNRGFLYLLRRGFEPDFIAANFGYIADPVHLRSVIPAGDLQLLGLFDSNGDAVESWRARVIIPGFDARGKLVGFTGRAIDEKFAGQDKYRYSSGFSPAKFGGFGLDKAKKFTRVTLVEGLLDVLKARQHGIENVVAAGTSNFSIDSVMALANLGIRELVVAFDSDKAGNAGVWSLLKVCDEQPAGPEVYVVDSWRGTKDPDEFLDRYGKAAFDSAVDTATLGCKWRARQWRNEFDFTRDGQLTAYIDRCTRYGESVTDARTQLRLKQYFYPEVAELTGVDLNDITACAEENRKRVEEKTRADAFIKKLSEAAGRARDGQIQAAEDILSELHSALNAPSQPYVSSVPMGTSIIEEVENDLRKFASREFIGIPNKTLPTLDRFLLGLRGFILLAGETNVGKTILLGQLALDAVRENEDVCVLFLTLEMSRKAILHRMWSHVANTPWVDLKEAFKPDSPDEYPDIWKARHLLDSFYRRFIRIWHPRDDRNTVATKETIINEIDDLRRTTGRQRCMVIIDYLDVLPVPVGMERATQTEIEKALCNDILDIRGHIGEDNPVLAVSEVRKKANGDTNEHTTNDIMGSARKGYSSDTDIIWHRWSDKLLLSTFEPYGEFLHRHPRPLDISDAQMRKPEMREQLALVNDFFRKRGISLSRLQISKVRDGGTKGNIDVTVNYPRNRIVEGVQL